MGPNGAGENLPAPYINRTGKGRQWLRGNQWHLGIYVPQMLPGEDFSLPITVREILLFAAASVKRTFACCPEEVGLQRLVDRQIQSLSGGEQKSFLARALLNKPDLLLFR